MCFSVTCSVSPRWFCPLAAAEHPMKTSLEPQERAEFFFPFNNYCFLTHHHYTCSTLPFVSPTLGVPVLCVCAVPCVMFNSWGSSPLLQGRALHAQQPFPDAGAAGAAPRREEHAHHPRAHTERLQQQPPAVSNLCFTAGEARE